MAYDFIRMDIFQITSSVAPFVVIQAVPNTSLDNPWNNPQTKGVDPFPYTYHPGAPFPTTAFQSFLPLNPDLKTTQQQQWNLAIQRQITPSVFASATYVGTHLIHTWLGEELNPAIYIPGNCQAGQYGLTALGPCTSTSNVNQRRILNVNVPGTQLGNITQYDDGGTQGYNGLLLATTLRMRSSVNLNVNYTWSHCIGLPLITLLNPGANYIHQGYGQNIGPVDRNLDVGDCAQDRRQVANITLVAQTPKFSNKFARAIGSDWVFASGVVARSGSPLTVVTGNTPDPATGFAGNPPGTQRPNQVLVDTASPNRNSSCGSAGSFCLQWINPAAFQSPVLGTFGNTGSQNILGPGFWEWDQAVSRQFSLTERQKLELRIEVFNPTNSLRPGNPAISTGAATTFGQIRSDATPPPGVSGPSVSGASGSAAVGSSTNAPSRVFQFALKYVF